MPRFAYVNGQFENHETGAVHIEDRGYQFADGVYEAWGVSKGVIVDFDLHLDRLTRSLSELRIEWPMSRKALSIVLREMRRRNRINEGIIYLQITRGVAPRDHPFPTTPVKPSIVITAKPLSRPKYEAMAEGGITIITVPDERWARPDIKSVSLLPNVLAIQKARDAGAFDAWQVDKEGFVSESSRTNAWIVDKDGNLVTRQVSNAILSGITRRVIVALMEKDGRKVIERAFTVEEAKSAREAFQSSASAWIMPVVEIDGQPIGNGAAGSVALSLRKLYLEHAAN